MNILINCFGIQDSGGVTVLNKVLNEISSSSYYYVILCNRNQHFETLLKHFIDYKHFEFMTIPSKGILHRLYYEHILFRKIIQTKGIKLVYNFSGTAQFFSKTPQLTKVHNLLFYSKTIDQLYLQNKQHTKWLKQVFLKRIIFQNMIRSAKYIETQSDHVKHYMSNFINTSNKQFFIKSDVETDKNILKKPKQYDLSKTIRFLYIVGPHFEYPHKNLKDFVQAMLALSQQNFAFEINITLTKEQLHKSEIWNKYLDDKTNFLGYLPKETLNKQFQNNTILVSTSVLETLGLHVIEAIQNGILAIVPNEPYSLEVYGKDMLTYKLFDMNTLLNTINNLRLEDNNSINDRIAKNQTHLVQNEKTKIKNIVSIFDHILKDSNV